MAEAANFVIVACQARSKGSAVVAEGRIAMAFIEPGLAGIYCCERGLLSGLQATSAAGVQSLDCRG